MVKNKRWLFLFFAFVVSAFCHANEKTASRTSSEIYHQLLKLKESKRVLYVAAHPDDENTRLIAYMGNHLHAEVAYLSLTRGDGGQNLIGKELGKELGMIRTQELLKAREIDGGRQYFTRALDFGFSKNPDETFNNWDKEELLGDVVWVIRNFRPDIIITRFSAEPGGTHGHHTTSAILAGEAFKIAGDSTQYPEQLVYTSTWQPKRIFWNAYNWGGDYEPEGDQLYHQYLVGEYNPLLGQTYSQIAADSRTMYKSQGFGATAQIGQAKDFIQLVDGPTFKDSPFDGVPNRWHQVDNGQRIEEMIADLLHDFDFKQPVNNLPSLLHIRQELTQAKGKENWLSEKRALLDEVIFNLLGLTAEFNAKSELSFPGKEIKSTLVFNNPSDQAIKVLDYSILDKKLEVGKVVYTNQPYTRDISITLPQEYPISQPYWLEEKMVDNLFSIKEQQAIGLAFNKAIVSGVLNFDLGGQHFKMELPLKYKYNDQVEGEVKQPFTITPEVIVHVNTENLFLQPGKQNIIDIEVGFFGELLEGKLTLEGLNESQYNILHNRTDEVRNKKIFSVEIGGLDGNRERQTVTARYTLQDGRIFDQDMRRIKYPHIPNLTHFPKSEFNILDLNLELRGKNIGYIHGAGDEVPEVLRQLGYNVTYLENLNLSNLKNYRTIITGIRAYNVNENLAANMDQLMEYVKDGGNLIVQYNTSSPLLTRQLGPYPLQLSRDRVTVEDSPVKFDKDHHVFSSPNQITEADFEGWVQERGLYFPGEWDGKYETPLVMNEPGESPTEGSLLLAEYGEGTFAYSGISWFRLLPAGVPGAIKLFVNLIERQGGEN